MTAATAQRTATEALVLLVEDDPDIAELVQFHLEKNNFRVAHIANGAEALLQIDQLEPDLVLLDLMLPGVGGLDILRKMREKESGRKIPIIIVSANGEESDVVIGLELGADDYVVKPFGPKELLARAKAALRRSRELTQKTENAAQAADRVVVGGMVIDQSRHEVTLNGKSLPLTLAEFRLLEALTSRPGRVFTRDQLLEKITGGEAYVIDRNVDVHVRSIRKKMESDADFILTVRGIGYKCREA